MRIDITFDDRRVGRAENATTITSYKNQRTFGPGLAIASCGWLGVHTEPLLLENFTYAYPSLANIYCIRHVMDSYMILISLDATGYKGAESHRSYNLSPCHSDRGMRLRIVEASRSDGPTFPIQRKRCLRPHDEWPSYHQPIDHSNIRFAVRSLAFRNGRSAPLVQDVGSAGGQGLINSRVYIFAEIVVLGDSDVTVFVTA